MVGPHRWIPRRTVHRAAAGKNRTHQRSRDHHQTGDRPPLPPHVEPLGLAGGVGHVTGTETAGSVRSRHPPKIGHGFFCWALGAGNPSTKRVASRGLSPEQLRRRIHGAGSGREVEGDAAEFLCIQPCQRNVWIADHARLIYKNRHGEYSFAVPRLGQFIRRQEVGRIA